MPLFVTCNVLVNVDRFQGVQEIMLISLCIRFVRNKIQSCKYVFTILMVCNLLKYDEGQEINGNDTTVENDLFIVTYKVDFYIYLFT